MHALIARWGVAGDIVPYLAVGSELRRRGHRVTFIANPFFERAARDGNLDFVPIGNLDDHRRLMADPSLFDFRVKSGEQVYAEHYYPHLEAFYEAAIRHLDVGSTVVFIGEAGAAVAAERRKLPMVRLDCSPASASFQSRLDPAHPQRVPPQWARWLTGSGARLAMLYRLNNLRHGIIRQPPLRRALPSKHPIALLRKRAGLTPETLPAADLTLCLWPEWFAPRQPDWPATAVTSGFVFDGAPTMPRRSIPIGDAALPIVATTGSAALGQQQFYETVTAACKEIDRKAIVVTPHRSNLPPVLPPEVEYLPHAEFAELFCRASLLVHHGGIGTASYGLAAGLPQIVMPLRGDQFDNGNRLTRLGVARMLSPRTSATELARIIVKQLTSPHVAARCGELAASVVSESGATRAAELLEAFAENRKLETTTEEAG